IYRGELDLPGPGVDDSGFSVALSADGSTAFVGAPNRTVNDQPGAGAVDIFTSNGGAWTWTSELNLGADAAKDENFGSSFSVSADGKTALVGASTGVYGM